MSEATQNPVIRVVAALVQRGDTYLITQRRSHAVLPLLWEFPGGRVETGEKDVEALSREIYERLGVAARIGALISYVHHTYARYGVDLYLYSCELEGTRLERRGVQDFRWVRSDEFDAYEFTPADEISVSRLLGISEADDPADPAER